MSDLPIFIVMGVSGCGKSTIGRLLALDLGIPFFDGDDYHTASNVKKMASGNPLNDDDRYEWLKRLNDLSKDNVKNGAVIACSALKKSYRNILQKDIEKRVHFVFLKGTFDEISQRITQRKNHFMPSGLLLSQFNTLEEPTNAITVSITKSPTEIVSSILKLYKPKKP